MAALTDKDRANLYRMAQGIEAKLVKQGYKKGTAEFKAAFARAAKGVEIAGRSISETGRVNRSSRATVKGTGKPATKPATPAASKGKAPDRPVRRRGASTTTRSTGSATGERRNDAMTGLAVAGGGAMIGGAVAGRAIQKGINARALAARQMAAARTARPMSRLPLRYQQVAAGVRQNTRPTNNRGNSTPSGRGRGTGTGAGGNVGGGGGGRTTRGGGPRRSGR